MNALGAWTDSISFAAATWLATYLMHSTLWLASAWLLAKLATSNEVREWAWRAAILGGLVTATLHGHIGASGPALDLAVQGPERARRAGEPERTGDVIALAGGSVRPPAEVRSSVPAAADAPAAAPVTSQLQWYHFATAVWVLGAAVGLFELARSQRRVVRALADRRPVSDRALTDALAQLARASGLARKVRLTSSAALTSPIALPGAEICVPERALHDLGPAEQATLLAHELAHLARRDPQWLRTLRVLERALFPQPLNRLAARRLEETAEYLCDAQAVRWTGEGRALARCLGAVASWHGRLQSPTAPAMVRHSSPLVERVARALSDAPPVRSTRQSWLAGTWIAATAVVLACQGPGLTEEDTITPAIVTENEEGVRTITATLEPAEPIERDAERAELEQRIRDYLAQQEMVRKASDAEPADQGEAEAAIPVVGDLFAESEPKSKRVVVSLAADGSARVLVKGPEQETPAGRVLTGRTTQVDAGADFRARLEPLLASAASRLGSEPDGPGHVSSGSLLLKVEPGVTFDRVQDVLETCASKDVRIWDVAFDLGDDREVATPLPRGVLQVEEGAPLPLKLELRIDVMETGQRVSLDGGEWAGKGPFRFEGRKMIYTLSTLGSPDPRLSMALSVGSPKGAAVALKQKREELPGVPLTIDARPGVVYEDLSGVVQSAAELGFEIRFVGFRGDK
jgi:beta-lactamase regulating signal transducer with metallopeptidase domain